MDVAACAGRVLFRCRSVDLKGRSSYSHKPDEFPLTSTIFWPFIMIKNGGWVTLRGNVYQLMVNRDERAGRQKNI
jgi:hypothetical protein